jgi:hypothetical protein
MAYNKDSGESKLRKNVNQNTYVRKKNKSIFKNSQTTQPPLKPQQKTNYDWDIPNVDMNIDVPYIGEFELYEKKTPRYEQKEVKYKKEEPQSFYEYERKKKEEQTKEKSEDKQERLSLKDIIIIIIANGFVPVAGGFVYYIVLASKGEQQKAMQSLVLSAIVSLIRIMYLVNTN